MVDRYDYPFIEDDDCWPQLLEKEEDGDFVLYQDYAALESENARLRAEVERLTALVQEKRS